MTHSRQVRLLTLVLVLLLISSLPALAQESPAQPAFEWNTLNELAQHVVKEQRLPGVALAWARYGEEPHIGVAGVRAEAGDKAVKPTDLFHIGSLTKSITATALGALVEQGVLNWSDQLRDLLSDMEMNEVFAEAELRQLLRHRARLPQHLLMDDAEMSRLNNLPGTPTEQRAAYVAEVLALDPLPDSFHYSNAGYSIAGYIAERTSGKSWEQLVHDEVFEPLELHAFGIGWPATDERPNQPRGHFGEPGNRRILGFDKYQLGAFMWPAGNLHCSVGDLARYGLAHLAGLLGENGFLKAETIKELHRADGIPYAAGWGVDPKSGQHRHRGSAGPFFSYLTIDPEAQLVIAFLTNTGPQQGRPASERVARAILDRYAQPMKK